MEGRYVHPQVCAGTLGWSLACSRTGSSHQTSGTSCQDAVVSHAGFIAGVPFLIAAVADGHGDPKYDRSASGALFAVYAAVETVHTLVLSSITERLSLNASRALKNDFPIRVRRRWRSLVEQDLASRQLQVSMGDGGVQRYGTTLLVAAVLDSHAYVCQIGDGDVVWIPDDGEGGIVTPHPHRGVVGETDSLLQPDAHLRFRGKSFECSSGGYLLLSSDGLSDAHADDGHFLAFVKDLATRFTDYGVARVSEVLPAWLDERSRRGSADDISLVVLRVNRSVMSSASIGSDSAGVMSEPEISAGESANASQGTSVTGRDEQSESDGGAPAG